jgi:hypothetical protein
MFGELDAASCRAGSRNSKMTRSDRGISGSETLLEGSFKAKQLTYAAANPGGRTKPASRIGIGARLAVLLIFRRRWQLGELIYLVSEGKAVSSGGMAFRN